MSRQNEIYELLLKRFNQLLVMHHRGWSQETKLGHIKLLSWELNEFLGTKPAGSPPRRQRKEESE